LVTQVLRQAPQFLGSALVSTHCVPHLVPEGQAQAPPLQTMPPVQATPQLPQLALLEVVSTQDPPQGTSPAPQFAVQVPSLHT
jgi:hypothetical protein